ncbi:MAG: hypothetical protein HN353_04480 [Bdellovibrionales bacterium]|jgi:hypothetical protein|nr:hypothetical protein [Bdellovibrionales bacterium]MBT3527458.1 hypothetical protein [Bdellovibrionales bacterium]MBT7670629.1 hypothetical protein [Bdellovibrionales bacterium]MBT7768073.1 hypothetical protein [Bdellovibrionales bacterium]
MSNSKESPKNEAKVEDQMATQEQGFDEDELKDIMDEIDSLEEEFAEAEGIASAESAETPEVQTINEDPVAEVEELTVEAKGQSGQLDQLDDVKDGAIADAMSELESAICQDEDEDESTVVPLGATTKSSPSNGGAMQETQASFNVAGNMSLNLNVTVSGQLITLSIDPDNGVTIEMEHGAKFSLPINSDKQAA